MKPHCAATAATLVMAVVSAVAGVAADPVLGSGDVTSGVEGDPRTRPPHTDPRCPIAQAAAAFAVASP